MDEKKLEEKKKDLDQLVGAYNEISTLNVTGDVVDLIASAKAKMRTVMNHLSNEIKVLEEAKNNPPQDDKAVQDQDDKPQSKPKGKKTK